MDLSYKTIFQAELEQLHVLTFKKFAVYKVSRDFTQYNLFKMKIKSCVIKSLFTILFFVKKIILSFCFS